MNVWNWEDHLPLLVGASATIFIAIRLSSVASFEPETAYEILQANGTGTVVVGSIVSLLGPALIAITIICWQAYISTGKEHQHRQRRGRLLVALQLLVGFSLFLTPTVVFVAIPVTVALALLETRLLRRWVGKQRGKYMTGSGEDRDEKARRVTKESISLTSLAKKPSVVISVLLVALYVFFSTPWFPSERISIRGAERTETGYILSATGDDITMLIHTSTGNAVRHFDPHLVIKRIPCDHTADSSKPPLALIFHFGTPYPKC
jgi:MFS family permease